MIAIIHHSPRNEQLASTAADIRKSLDSLLSGGNCSLPAWQGFTEETLQKLQRFLDESIGEHHLELVRMTAQGLIMMKYEVPGADKEKAMDLSLENMQHPRLTDSEVAACERAWLSAHVEIGADDFSTQ